MLSMIKLLVYRLTISICSGILRALIKLNLKYTNQIYVISKSSSAARRTGHRPVKARVAWRLD